MSFLFEQALREKCSKNPDVALLQTQWEYDRRLVAEALQTVGWTFPHYSRHDVSHSNSILVQLARVLGQTRVEMLSATDIWLMLEAAYQHDIGMVITDDQARAWLRSPGFGLALERLKHSGDAELVHAANFISSRPELQSLSAEWPLDVRRALTLVLADYGRAEHARNAERIVLNPQTIGLLSPRTALIPDRLFRVLGKVCAHHGRSFEDTMLLPEREAGLGTDEAHPRFIACMLRIGDLLDLDNGRFCPVMMKGFGSLPPSSAAHFEKHASIKHLELGPTRVEVEAECETYEAYEVTEQWLVWLREEIKNQMARWSEIVPQSNLGSLPSLGRISANLKGHIALESGRRPRFEVDREAILTIVKGGNIYGSPEACIRELLQNSIDATLLRLWRERWSTLDRDRLNQLDPSNLREALASWPAQVKFKPHVIDGMPDKVRWHFSVVDRGTGIAFDELRYIQSVGGSSKNPRRQQDLARMPEWMHPSGVFGIGLQSVFLLTNQVDILTRHHETRDVFKISVRNGVGPGTDGLVIRREENPAEVARVEVGTTIEFDVVLRKAPDDFLKQESSEWRCEVPWPRLEENEFEGEMPWLVANARKLALDFARNSPVAFSVEDGVLSDAEKVLREDYPGYFDRATGLLVRLRASVVNSNYVSDVTKDQFFYRGARIDSKYRAYTPGRHWPMVDPLLSVRCDISFGRATSILELNREGFTMEGAAMVQTRLDEAMVRVFPKYIAALRAQVVPGALPPDELRVASLYAYLDQRFRPEVAGQEWRALKVMSTVGSLLTVEGSGEYVELERILACDSVEYSEFGGAPSIEFGSSGLAKINVSASLFDEWDWLLRVLRTKFLRCTYMDGVPSGVTMHRVYRFSNDLTADVITESGLRAQLRELTSSFDGVRSLPNFRRTIPCAGRFRALEYSGNIGGVLHSEPAWVVPRMVCPFVLSFRDRRIIVPNVAKLVEWTAVHRVDVSQGEQEIAQSMWNFIEWADKIMCEDWKEHAKGYDLKDIKRELARWIRLD